MTVVVKLGSAIVAGDDGEVRADVLDSVCEQVAHVHAAGDEVVMVTSGAIARGMGLMGMADRPGGLDELQGASAVGQGPLFRAYEERLARHDLRAAQVLLTGFDISVRMHYLNARQTLRRLLAWHAVPVINENDTTATDEITFGDNDFLSAQVAIMIEARMLVLLTDTEGVYTADPRTDSEAKLIHVVREFAELDEHQIGTRTSRYGSGGMRSKVIAAEMASTAGIQVVICDGTAHGALAEAVAGEAVGTRFEPHESRAPSFKLWLRYATPARGRLVVDEGAARVLREKGSSLLPVGIISVEGDFAAGDAVEVICNGELVGKGITEHGAPELLPLIGKRTDEVAELAPGAPVEAIHRDRFVLT
jgi:glutamate 5-kinase